VVKLHASSVSIYNQQSATSVRLCVILLWQTSMIVTFWAFLDFKELDFDCFVDYWLELGCTFIFIFLNR